MPTDGGGAAALFLFAHQDDEFGVYDEIARAARAGAVHCAYLTDGAAGGDPARRDAESLRVLERLGVPAENVHSFGVVRGIADGRMRDSLPAVADAIAGLLDAMPTARVHVPAWEGGHPDHDTLNAVTAQLLLERGRLADGRQFSLYHAHRRPGPLFRVLSPLAANGVVTTRRLTLAQRLRQVRLCLAYPSQRRTWLGLFPFVATRLLFVGRQALQPLSAVRTSERPHAGPLYYEKRGFDAYPQLSAALAAWRDGRTPSSG